MLLTHTSAATVLTTTTTTSKYSSKYSNKIFSVKRTPPSSILRPSYPFLKPTHLKGRFPHSREHAGGHQQGVRVEAAAEARNQSRSAPHQEPDAHEPKRRLHTCGHMYRESNTDSGTNSTRTSDSDEFERGLMDQQENARYKQKKV